MNQYQWTFLDNAARRHTLGIAHGARSGNLVVHCNAQIVKIDFSVLEPRTYSFFVEEELCHLAIEGDKDSGFHYNFHIDTEVDTPVNRERNLKRITSRRRGLLMLFALVLFVGGVVGGIAYLGWSAKQAELQRELYVRGVSVSAKLDTEGTLEFIGHNRVIQTEPMPQDAARLEALGAGALVEVPVRYYNEDPDKVVVDWRRVFKEIAAAGTSVGANEGGIPRRDFSPATAMLLEGLAPELPAAAGAPVCALRAAGALGNFRNQLSLIDAYALGDAEDAERWTATVQLDAYRDALSAACPQ